jgi:hypothetical protein
VSGREDREGAPAPYASGTPFRPAATDPLLQRAIPVAKELPGYRTPTARRDVLAGVTVAALAIPSAMAVINSSRATAPTANVAALRSDVDGLAAEQLAAAETRPLLILPPGQAACELRRDREVGS